MQTVDLPGSPKDQWALGNAAKGYIVYSNTNSIHLDLAANASYKAKWINPKTGEVLPDEQQVKGGSNTEIKNPGTGEAILWLVRI